MDIYKLKKLLNEHEVPRYRYDQVVKAVYENAIIDFDEITALSKDLRVKLKEEFDILSFVRDSLLISKDGTSVKAKIRFKDGKSAETVIMRMRKGEWTACVSSQIGCAIGCIFCATGSIGFQRNLTSEEIADQVLYWQNYLKKQPGKEKITNIVFMGMGEPLLNWQNVSAGLAMFLQIFKFGARSISLSTVGIPEGIKKMAKEFPQVNLAISLHSADDKKRDALTPINRRYNLKQLQRALEYYFDHTNRKVFLEYIMIKNVNDRKEDANGLIDFIGSLPKPHLLHVNLIPYNLTISGLEATAKDGIEKFKNYLEKNKISVTIRKSLGEDIKGACGQLAA